MSITSASLLVFLAAQSGPVVFDRVAAVVNSQVVLQSEVETLLEQMNQLDPIPPSLDKEETTKTRRAQILDNLIAEKLLEQEVRKLHIDVTDAEVDRIVKQTMVEHNLDDAKLKLALAQQGLTLDEYKEGLKKQLTKMKIVQLKVKSRVQVNDQDVKSRLAQERAMKAAEYRVRAKHILLLVPAGAGLDVADVAKKRIEAIRASLLGGDPSALAERFSAAAQANSEDPGSKNQGGSLGEFGRGEMVAEFEHAAFAAEPGQLVGPVRTPFGWHLIYIEARVPLQEKPVDEVMKDLRNRLHEDQTEEQFHLYLDELRRQASVQILGA